MNSLVQTVRCKIQNTRTDSFTVTLGLRNIPKMTAISHIHMKL